MPSAQIYNGGVESGGTCPCATPPTPISSTAAASRTVKINSLAVVLSGDSMPPVPGTKCPGKPRPCTSSRTVIASAQKVMIEGKKPALPNDVLNSSTNIRLTMASASPNVFYS